MEVSPSRSLGSFEPIAWRMKVRRMPSAPPNSPASNTTLSRGDAWPDWEASVVVQSSWANTNAAKSTSWESSTSRSRVDRPGLNVVVQGSMSATSLSPRVIAWSSLACLPDDPRKMRGLFMRDSSFGQETRVSVLDSILEPRPVTRRRLPRVGAAQNPHLRSGGALLRSDDLGGTGLRSHNEEERRHHGKERSRRDDRESPLDRRIGVGGRGRANDARGAHRLAPDNRRRATCRDDHRPRHHNESGRRGGRP